MIPTSEAATNAAQTTTTLPTATACTMALRRALTENAPAAQIDDLLFLEAWERAPAHGIAAALRLSQIRRANPGLAAEIRAELNGGRPLTALERAALNAVATGDPDPVIRRNPRA